MWGARSANGPLGLTLAPAECRSHLLVLTPYAALETAIQHVVPVSAVAFASLAPVTDYVVPTPEATFDETALASEHMAPALDDVLAAPAPATHYVALAPSDTDTTPESMTEFVALAPAVYYATPAPPIEFVTPSLVIEYRAPAPSVTCLTPSPQLPLAYTMADLVTGVIVDTTCAVNSQSPITDVGASASQVRGSLPHFEKTNVDTETFRYEKWNLCGAAMSDDDACPRPRLCTEHFDLTADGSQGLADGMHGCELACPCRTATPHRVMVGHTAHRWPVR